MKGPIALGSAAPLTLDSYEAIVHKRVPVVLADDGRIAARRDALETRIAAGDIIYGVNTGYGAEAVLAVPDDALARMQVNTVAAHACGVGAPAAPELARGALALMVQTTAQGAGAYSPEIVDALIELLNSGRDVPVPALGSQSASDLMPLAAIALELDVDYGAKDGLIINTNAFTGALAVETLRTAERLVDRAEEIAALSLQALRGFREAFDERLVALRPHPGAVRTAAHMRELLDGSALLGADNRPHDPFSLRAIPQVHGAIRDAVGTLRAAVEVELSSSTDNPIVTADGDVLSGANFHGAPLGLPLDYTALALCELATLSHLRTRHLVSGSLGTPRKLTPEPAERLGMLLQPGVAAALVSEARLRSNSASRESIGFDHMEDHVSMSALAGRQALEVAGLVRRVLAVELLCAAQALDYAGVASASPAARDLHAQVRERVPTLDEDRPLSADSVLDLV